MKKKGFFSLIFIIMSVIGVMLVAAPVVFTVRKSNLEKALNYSLGDIFEQNVSAYVIFIVAIIIYGLLFYLYVSRYDLIRRSLDYQRSLEIIKGLSYNFEYLSYIDTTTDVNVVYHINDYFSKIVATLPKNMPENRKFDVIINSILAPDDREHFFACTKRDVAMAILRENGVFDCEFKAIIDGRTQYYNLKMALDEFNPDGVIVGIFDIDDNKKHEMEMMALNSQLDEARRAAEFANDAKSTFLFNMSHDIRTPMNAILGFTDRAILHHNDEAVLLDSLDKVKESGQYLLKIIDDILDMARIESGTFALEEQITDIRNTSENVGEMICDSAFKRDITVHHRIEGVTHYYVWSPDLRIRQIVMNLMTNAIKYSNPGGEVWHTVRELPCDRPGYCTIEITIADSGIGMSEEFITKIFDRFEREYNTTESGRQGTGLGMTIVKRIVDLLGGKIDIKSKIGEGTTVRVTMDFRIVDAAEVRKYEMQKSADLTIAFDFTGKKVLLVEDNELNRELSGEMLTDVGITVDEAVDGKVAIDMIADKGIDYYDLILMDIQMPIMNGYEATEVIRKRYPDCNIPIIALSANAFEADRQKSLASGMNEHLPKPIEPSELYTLMNKLFANA